jgi:DUF4097 and DUF4098 domain-containing protein YvlB
LISKPKFVTALFAAALAVALGAAPATLHAQESSSRSEASRIYRDGSGWVQEITGSISAAKGLKLSSTEGSIQIQGSTSNSQNITYTIKKHVYRSSEDSARRDLTSFEVRVSHRADYVLVEGEGSHSHGRYSVEFNLTVPKSTSWVKLETMGGSVGVKGIDGWVRAETAGGSISVDQIGGPVTASTQGGSISAGHVNNNVSLETAGGSITVGSIAGHIVANTSGGSVEIDDGKQNVSIETAGGSIRVKQCGGSLTASTAGGTIDVGDVGSNASLESAGGGIHLTSAKGWVKAETASGPIRLTNISRGVKAETAAGPIEVEITAGKGQFTASQLETAMGDIVIYLPSDLGVTVKAGIEMANGHGILSDFPGLKITSEGGQYEPREVYAEGSLNGGGPILKVHTTNGSITFRKTAESKSARK